MKSQGGSHHAREPRYLIVNADDFGLSDGVCEGIVRAWREGMVTSTSVLINVEGARERVLATRSAHPDLPIGLHLNVTTGRPVLPPECVPTLVDAEGRFYPLEALLARLPRISLEELQAELRAQAEALLACGVRFDHIDYHSGVVVIYTPFYDLVRDLAREYRVPVRQPAPEPVYGRMKLEGGGGAGREVARLMLRFALRHPILAAGLMRHATPAAFKSKADQLKLEGIPAPDWFVEALYGNPTVERLLAILEQLPPGVSELTVHPAVVDEPLRALGEGYVEQRARELAVLLDPRPREAAARQGIELVDFSFLRAPAQT